MTPINNGTSRLSNLETKFESFMREMSDFKQEMRDRDNQRAEDIREIRASMAGMDKHVRNISIATIVGVGTAVIAVVVLVGTTVYSILTR